MRAASAAVGRFNTLEGFCKSTIVTVLSLVVASRTQIYFSDSMVSVAKPMAAGFTPNAVS